MNEPFIPTQTVIMADDDPDDCLLTQDAWEESGSPHTIRFVRDGEELLDYLHHRRKFSDSEGFPLPCMILLDLHMPKRNGHEALQEIRSQGSFQHIPIVVITNSNNEDETCRSYALGANACLTKPRTAQEYQSVIGTLSQYWSYRVQLPSDQSLHNFYNPTRSWV